MKKFPLQMLSGETAKFSSVKIFFIEFILVATPIFISYHILVKHSRHSKSNVMGSYGGFQPGLGDLGMAYVVIWADPGVIYNGGQNI